jgi:oligopeptide transport system permease protein
VERDARNQTVEEVPHVSPELAGVDEAIERSIPPPSELVAGSSLWRDAWRRLLKNKLAVAGGIVVALCTRPADGE